MSQKLLDIDVTNRQGVRVKALLDRLQLLSEGQMNLVRVIIVNDGGTRRIILAVDIPQATADAIVASR